MAKVMLVTGLIVAYGYTIEAFIAWYSANQYEGFMLYNRVVGPYWWAYSLLILCNVIVPQALWFKRVRTNVVALFALSIVVNIGMWLERFVIIVTSLHRDFLVSSWGRFAPTFWDWSTYIGTIGLFVMLLLIFMRLLPAVSILEMRSLVPEGRIDQEVRES
jgi:molybdopterin-containing oxidoreductase family membrane subunit